MFGVIAAILELWKEALLTFSPNPLYFLSFNLCEPLSFSLCQCSQFPHLWNPCLVSFHSLGYHPVSLLPTPYILLSVFTCSPHIPSSFTCNLAPDFITFRKHFTHWGHYYHPNWQIQYFSVFIFLNLSVAFSNLNNHFCLLIILLSSKTVYTSGPPFTFSPLFYGLSSYYLSLPHPGSKLHPDVFHSPMLS